MSDLLEFLATSAPQFQEVPEYVPEYAWWKRKPGEEGIYQTPSSLYWGRKLAGFLPLGEQFLGEKSWLSPDTLMELASLIGAYLPSKISTLSMRPNIFSIGEKSKPLRVYHGTYSPEIFEKTSWLKPRDIRDDFYGALDPYLGVHVSRDPRIANVFAEKDYVVGSGHRLQTKPRVFPLDLYYHRIYNVTQPRTLPGNRPIIDYMAIHRDAANKFFSDVKNKEKFVENMHKYSFMEKDVAEKVWKLAKEGKKKELKKLLGERSYDYMKKSYGDVDLGSIYLNYVGTSRLPISAIDYYKNELLKKGYDVISYINTSPEETKYVPEIADRISYIVLNPDKLRSPFERRGGLLRFLREHED